MDRSTTLHFTKPLLRKAVRGFWWRVVGFRFLLALALVATELIMAVQRGDTSSWVGVLGSVCALGIGFAVALYVVHYRNSVNKQHAMGRPHATLEVSDSQVTVSSGAGTLSFPWATVTEVWQFKTCWPLVLCIAGSDAASCGFAAGTGRIPACACPGRRWQSWLMAGSPRAFEP